MDAGPWSSSGKQKEGTRDVGVARTPAAKVPNGVPGRSDMIEDEAEEEDDDEDESDEDEDEAEGEDSADEDGESVDSEGDLEGIQPRRGAASGEKEPHRVKSGQSFEKWQPPAGTTPISVSTDMRNSPFEYSKLSSNPNLQLWTIRVPGDFKPSRLASLELSLNGAIASGSLKTKSTTYTLSSSIASSSNLKPKRAVDSMAIDSEHPGARARTEGAEEMAGGMRLMVPNLSGGGKWQIAPIPITQHLLLAPDLSVAPASNENEEGVPPLPSFLATQTPASTSTPADQMEGLAGPSRKKRVQPTHLLKFRNRVSGFDTPGHRETSRAMDGVEQIGKSLFEESPPIPAVPTPNNAEVAADAKRRRKEEKKRQSDAGVEISPKKKKVKAT